MLTPEQHRRFLRRLSEESIDLKLDRIPRRADQRLHAPLSFAQQRIWFFDQLEQGSSAYIVPLVLRLAGPINVEALERAFEEVIRRHDVLRTHFDIVNGQPVQIVKEPGPFRLFTTDLIHLTHEEREQLTKQLSLEELSNTFDLSQGPLFRARLLQREVNDHLLLITQHHIITDAWSNDVLMRELSSLYQAYSTGKVFSLPELGIQYGDYSLWQREWLQGDVLEQQLTYWRERLADLSVLELPTDYRRPPTQNYNGAKVSLRLSERLTASLKRLSEAEGLTLFMTLLGAFTVVLGKYTSQHDIVVGTPVANRSQPQTQDLIGCFLNTLVLRVDTSGNPSFRELLARVKDVCIGAYSHQDLPFEQLVQDLCPVREQSRHPLFQVMFQQISGGMGALNFGELSVQPMSTLSTFATFDFYVGVTEDKSELSVTSIYATSLFSEETICRLFGHWTYLMEQAVAHPETRLSELSLVSDLEEQRLLVEFNSPQSMFCPDKCIHQLFEVRASHIPNAIALVFGNERISYRELNERANQLGRYLKTLRVGPNVLVGLFVERSVDTLVGLLGILKAGGAYVPIDSDCPRERISFILEDTQVSLLLTQEFLLNRAPQFGGQVVCLDRDWLVVNSQSKGDIEPSARPQDIAYVIYTSGSTGKPKGVLVSHYNVVRLFQSTQGWFGFNESDVWTLFHSYAFDFSVWEIWGALAYGGKLVVVPHFVSRSTEEFYKLLVDEGVTVLNQTPSAFTQLIEADCSQSIAEKQLSLRLIIFGGEALNPEILRPWYARHDAHSPQLVNMYGITETTVHATFHRISHSDLAGQSVIGARLPDLSIYILDSDLKPVPIGVPGELYVGGAGVAMGYLNRTDLTNERFVSNPFRSDPDPRLYRSGDKGRYLPNGEIEFLGRLDYQVKIRGFRIELAEVESALITHPSIKSVAVVVQEGTPADKCLVAYLAAHHTIAIAELRKHLKQSVPEYMLPSMYIFLDALPLTANGKLDRKALPMPENVRSEFSNSFTAPSSPLEKEIAAIWSALLKVKDVGIHDNFFELGGHSLLMTQLAGRIRAAYLVEIPLRLLFDSPTIVGIGRLIAEKQMEQEDPLELARLLEEIQSLSPGEIARRIAEING